jgi:hypothetical protein
VLGRAPVLRECSTRISFASNAGEFGLTKIAREYAEDLMNLTVTPVPGLGCGIGLTR